MQYLRVEMIRIRLLPDDYGPTTDFCYVTEILVKYKSTPDISKINAQIPVGLLNFENLGELCIVNAAITNLPSGTCLGVPNLVSYKLKDRFT